MAIEKVPKECKVFVCYEPIELSKEQTNRALHIANRRFVYLTSPAVNLRLGLLVSLADSYAVIVLADNATF